MTLIAILLAALISGAPACADNIRGPVVREVRLRQDGGFEQTVDIRYQEFVAVYLPEDIRFLEGVQIELVLSSALRESYDSFGIVIYDSLQPLPVIGERSFVGRRAFFHYLVALNRLFYHLSVDRDATGSTQGRHNPTQGLFRPALPSDSQSYPILVGIVPIMKGIPDSLRDQRFYLRVTPRLADMGLLSLRLHTPESTENASYEIRLDGKLLATPSEIPIEIEFATGLHTLRVTSDSFRPVDTTFSIEAGQTNEIEVDIEPLTGRITIEAPSIATVYIDGTRYSAKDLTDIELQPGEHTVRFKIGDYSSTRTFTVTRGKNYAIYLELAIAVKEY